MSRTMVDASDRMVVVDCGLTSHSAILQLYNDGSDRTEKVFSFCYKLRYGPYTRFR